MTLSTLGRYRAGTLFDVGFCSCRARATERKDLRQDPFGQPGFVGTQIPVHKFSLHQHGSKSPTCEYMAAHQQGIHMKSALWFRVDAGNKSSSLVNIRTEKFLYLPKNDQCQFRLCLELVQSGTGLSLHRPTTNHPRPEKQLARPAEVAMPRFVPRQFRHETARHNSPRPE